MPAPGEKTIASNRRAHFSYHVEERFEAGIELVGSEVKAIRAGLISINEAYCSVRAGEAFLTGATIQTNARAPWQNHEAARDRRLLLHGREIEQIRQRIDEKGYTLVPLRLYFKAGRVKVEIALARGKNVVDKRQTMAERDAQREIDRVVKRGDRD
jgi:SsrA-binding protein